MSVDFILMLLEKYGPIIIFVCVFFGVIGIPAPEETLIVIAGIFIQHGNLPLGYTLLMAFLGVFCGFLFSYMIGKFAGIQVFHRITKFLRMDAFKVKAFQERYAKGYRKAILIGLYIPGARQINPYLAGMSNIRFSSYLTISLIGTSIWVFPFLFLGYGTAHYVDIPYRFLPWIGIVIGGSFILYFVIRYLIKKNRTSSI